MERGPATGQLCEQLSSQPHLASRLGPAVVTMGVPKPHAPSPQAGHLPIYLLPIELGAPETMKRGPPWRPD